MQRHRLSGARELFKAAHFHFIVKIQLSRHKTDPEVMSDQNFEVAFSTKPHAERDFAHTKISSWG